MFLTFTRQEWEAIAEQAASRGLDDIAHAIRRRLARGQPDPIRMQCEPLSAFWLGVTVDRDGPDSLGERILRCWSAVITFEAWITREDEESRHGRGLDHDSARDAG